ncbi:MAG: sialate O-acetylesterase [Bacilli bacterium]|nr:sialate O-acetylesterase [Bacilli bacterium]
MKPLYIATSIVLLLLSSCGQKEDKYKHLIKPGKANIVLITGQSNASGNSPWSYLENKKPEVFNKYKNGFDGILTNYYVHDSNNIDFFEPTRFGMADSKSFFGPEIGIVDTLSSLNETTYIIKFAIGGSRLDNEWLNSNGKKGRYYNDSISWFKDKLEYLKSHGVEPNIIGQFWMQGEGDSIDPFKIKYESNLKALINFYRDDLKDYYVDHYKFIDAYISTKTIWPDPYTVNKAKQNVADSDPYVYVIKTNGEDENSIDLNIKKASNEGDDAAHYDSISEFLLGQAVGKILSKN